MNDFKILKTCLCYFKYPLLLIEGLVFTKIMYFSTLFSKNHFHVCILFFQVNALNSLLVITENIFEYYGVSQINGKMSPSELKRDVDY